jgi:hypothetical protein
VSEAIIFPLWGAWDIPEAIPEAPHVGLFIKNSEVERKARELAALTGESLTAAIDRAVDVALQ